MDWGLLDTKIVTLTPSEVTDWGLLDTKIVTLTPSEEEVAEWGLLDTKIVTLTPSEEEIADWGLLDTKIVILTPKGAACQVDSDCPEGYICKDGVCVKAEEAGAFPWGLLAAGGLGAAALVLLIPKEKPEEKPKQAKKKST
jgi:hypothetical protein